MKQRNLIKVALRVLGDPLQALGFLYDRGTYYREMSSGIMHLIGMGLDPHGSDEFRFMCGYNSRILHPDTKPRDMGYAGRDDVHLTPDGWDYNSGCWPCDDESQALESLTTIKGMIDTHIEPRFQSKTTLSSLADEMNADRRGIEMATLYRAEGDIERARQALMQYRERLEKPQSWADPKRVAADIKRVDSLLQEIR